MVTGLVTMAIGSLLFCPGGAYQNVWSVFDRAFYTGRRYGVAANRIKSLCGLFSVRLKVRQNVSASWEFAMALPGVLAPAILGFITLDGADEIVEKIKTMAVDQKKMEFEHAGIQGDHPLPFHHGCPLVAGLVFFTIPICPILIMKKRMPLKRPKALRKQIFSSFLICYSEYWPFSSIPGSK